MAKRKSTVVKKISLQVRRVTRLHENDSEDRPSYAPYILDIGKADNDAIFFFDDSRIRSVYPEDLWRDQEEH